MTDYKETEVTGTSWQRCDAVTISNPRNAVPTVRMSEEIIANLGGNEFSKTAQGLAFAFDPSIVIPLLNPVTGLSTGSSMTGMDVYVALYSLYILKAAARDAGV